MSRLFRLLAVTAALGFVGFFVWIVTIANRAGGTPWWSFITYIPYGDKVGHLALVGLLAFLCNLAFPSRKWWLVTKTTLVLLLIITLEELSQVFIVTRHLDLFDWLADLAGLVLGQFSAGKFRQFLKSRATTAP